VVVTGTGSSTLLSGEAGVRAAYAAHGEELYRFARRSLGDAGLAEEAVQETFLRAWRAADRYDEQLGSLRTWLFAICRNVVIDMGRARSVRPPLVGPEPADVADDDTAFDRALIAWQVEEALRRLSADHRRVLVEVHYRGRSYQEVATALGVPEGTVKSRVYYALRALRLALEEMGVDDRVLGDG
jgi:RNA polymerase sigma-70 factor (ECF subfamily)